MKIDIKKKYTWRGRPAIIHAINGPDSAFPIIASTMNPGGDWDTDCYKPDSFEEIREPREWTLRAHSLVDESEDLHSYTLTFLDIGGNESPSSEAVHAR